jgi:hypothetical protein
VAVDDHGERRVTEARHRETGDSGCDNGGVSPTPAQRAQAARLHGPYHQWTRKKNGKTATRWNR